MESVFRCLIVSSEEIVDVCVLGWMFSDCSFFTCVANGVVYRVLDLWFNSACSVHLKTICGYIGANSVY